MSGDYFAFKIICRFKLEGVLSQASRASSTIGVIYPLCMPPLPFIGVLVLLPGREAMIGVDAPELGELHRPLLYRRTGLLNPLDDPTVNSRLGQLSARLSE